MFDYDLLNFRGFQVSQDLAAAAKTIVLVESSGRFAGFELFLGKTEEIAGQWLTMVDSRVAIQPDGMLRARAALIEGAQRAETRSPPLFQAATALLLADVLQNGDGAAIEPLYAACRRSLDTMPAAVRAALMQGFRLAHDLRHLRIDPLPDPGELTTRHRDDVLRDLFATVRAMTPQELQAVAQSDYGIGTERHLNALKRILAGADGRFPPDDPCHPAEVVRWCANNPRATGFLPCLALLCLNAVQDGDTAGELAFLWSQLGPRLAADPRPALRPILDGFRHLSETDPDWSPYPGWNDLLIRGQGTALPWQAPDP